MRFVDETVARRLALEGAVYLAQSVDERGQFHYWRPSETSKIRVRRYNTLRHCGSVWAMLETARTLGLPIGIIEGGLRALRYALTEFIRPFGAPDIFCLLDDEKIKLGGSGLALIALAAAQHIDPNEQRLKIATGLGRYVQSQAKDNGDFIHGRMHPMGVEYPLKSEYYTGQALFGLLALSEMTVDRSWGDFAIRCLKQLATRDYGVAEYSHWMLYALEASEKLEATPALRALGARIATAIINRPKNNDGKENATLLACMSEGLLAWVRLVGSSPPRDGEPDVASVVRKVRQNLSLQFKYRNVDGSFVGGSGDSGVRIDYVQHNISAFAAFALFPKL